MQGLVFVVMSGIALVAIGIVIGQYLVLSDGQGMEKICGIIRMHEGNIGFQIPDGLNVSLNMSLNKFNVTGG